MAALILAGGWGTLCSVTHAQGKGRKIKGLLVATDGKPLGTLQKGRVLFCRFIHALEHEMPFPRAVL